MGKGKYQDIEIRGVVYPDANAAAAAHGVTPDAVRIAVRRGTLHRVGTGAAGVEPMRVRVGGIVFDCAASAAAHFGVTTHAIYQAITRGRTEEFGRPPRNARNRSKPIQIGTLSFPSMCDADRALGFAPGYISQVNRRGYKRGRERILAAALQYVTRGKHQEAV